MSELSIKDILMMNTDSGGSKNENKELKERMLDGAFNKKNIKMKTDLKNNQIVPIIKLELFASIFKNKSAKTVLKNMYELSVSKDRKGRKEYTDMARNAYSDTEFSWSQGVRNSLMGKD
jgi:hypothetical protein